MAARPVGGEPVEAETRAGEESLRQQERTEPRPVSPELFAFRTDHLPEPGLVQEPTFVCIQSSDMCNNNNYEVKHLVSRGVIGIQQSHPERASQDGFFVSVVFPGLVTREGCYVFTCELLKHILYQRQQLPLPYEQLEFFYRNRQQDEPSKKSRSKELADRKKCQRVLADLEEIICNLETLFTLTIVPRVLLLLGGSTACPKEMYEINMEGVLAGSAEQSLKTRPCLRKLFHSLFVTDAFSEFKASPIMGAVLMVQGHRSCGTEWFRPKLNFKVPSRGLKLQVNLSCADKVSDLTRPPHQTSRASDDDYVWFQAPVTLKGFHD
ncbi:MAD2L1-binding protein isoform X2 [Pleurodeles waltl]|uniref:MAD2L1-binding protein isoform X2 n=1 Tax=Pleurodeles waltl TaxID=8319 RepID=UPI0037098796